MRIAVVGGGISGLAAAWLLGRCCEVTLFEAGEQAGGHSNTVSVPEPVGAGESRQVPIDTGFIVYNRLNYPHLTALFDHLAVPTAASDMSFAASLEDGGLEYAGDHPGKLFGQPANLLRVSHWRMIGEILRFNRHARDWLAAGRDRGETLQEFLDAAGFSPRLAERYLLPMAAAIWSAPRTEIGRFPAASLLGFFRNHGLLQVRNRPQWRTVRGGSREYVRRLLADFGGRVRTATPVTAVRPQEGGVRVSHSGGTEQFDQVVLAVHADQARSLLEEAHPEATRLLADVRFSHNRAVLHSDPALMPRRRRLWASWNYLSDGSSDADRRVSVSYWMNRLQPLDSERDYFVSLNPLREPDPDRCWYRTDYSHPVLDAAALRIQQQLPALQGRRGIWFAGAWTRYGFHEDGMRSALWVANALGVAAPWQSLEARGGGARVAGRHARMAQAAVEEA